jgi:RNA polymerase sigma factor (sigma-70 family)
MSLDILSLPIAVPSSLIARARTRIPAPRDSESSDRDQPSSDAEEIYRRHLPLIEQIALSVCRRHGVGDHDAEDFASDVLLKLCANDYAVIRKFQNKSSFATYLTVVINKTFLDHRRRLWGKWTPSTQAKRFGPIGVQFEKLIYRDRHSFDAACDILIQKHPLTIDRQTLREMFAKLPRRSPPRRIDGDSEIPHVATDDEADTDVIAQERGQRVADAMRALDATLRALPDEDRAIIRLLYFERMSIADVARSLHLEQKRLYPRLQRLLARLKKSLAERDISPDVVGDLDPG